MTAGLPPWLPEWENAESIAAEIDTTALRADTLDLVEYVLAEDTAVLDALPEDVESALVTPMAILGRVCNENRGAIELVVAARLVRRAAEAVIAQCPPDLLAKLQRLPE